jgi:nicotinamidase-related amidase
MKSFNHYLHNNSKTAVLVIDMINEFCSPGGWADLNNLDYTYCEKCINPIKTLLKKCRTNGIPIIWLNWGIKNIDSLPKNQYYLWKKKPSDIGLEAGLFEYGSDGVQIIPDLKKEPNDILISKERISGFYGDELNNLLQKLNIKTLLFAGVNTDQCVLHTMADGNFLGYECILLQDCCATNSPPYAEKAALYNAAECFGKVKNLNQIF